MDLGYTVVHAAAVMTMYPASERHNFGRRRCDTVKQPEKRAAHTHRVADHQSACRIGPVACRLARIADPKSRWE